MKLTLKAMRVNNDLTVTQVANMTGFSKSTIWKWEQGLTEPSIKKLSVLLELYGFKFEDIKI